MAQPDLPRRFFADHGEPSGDRVNHYFKLSSVTTVLKALQPQELQQIKPCFEKLLDIYSKPVFSGKLAHFLLTRQLDVVKRHEIWCVFAGKPIRFSLREFGLVTGLNCNPLPPLNPDLLKAPPGVTPYWFTLFGGEESVTGEMLLAKLWRPRSLTEEKRVKYACLLLVDGLLCRRSFHMKIPKGHVEFIRNLKDFLEFPWGRYCFAMTMESIKSRSINQLAQPTVAIQGFIHALVLVFVEAVPAVLSATGDGSDPESGEDEDFPVVSLKLDKIWDLDGEDEVTVLPIIHPHTAAVGDFSWADEVPDPRVEAMTQLIEEGSHFKRDMFVGGVAGLPAPVVPPARAVNKAKGKRKVNVRVVGESSGTQKPKKSKKAHSLKDSTGAEPVAKLLAAVSSQFRADLKESQGVVYANVRVDMKEMELRLEQHIRKTVTQGLAEFMHSNETVNKVIEDLNGGYERHAGETRDPMNKSNQGYDAPAPNATDSRTTSVDQSSNVGGGSVDVAVIVEGALPNAENSMHPKFKKLTLIVDPTKLLTFGHGLTLKETDLLSIPTVISPDTPQVMDSCLRVVRDSLLKTINPDNDPRSDMLPCAFYGSLSDAYAKFKKARRRDAFEFQPDLLAYLNDRFKKTGREWLKDVDFLYSPFNIDKNRWVGLVVDLPKHTLTVFDCTADARRGSRLRPDLEFICNLFPYLVRAVACNDSMKDFSPEPLTFVRNTHVTQATDRSKTGMLSLLFMEAHMLGGSEEVRHVTESIIRNRAEELAVAMYEHCCGTIELD